jgi:3-isopropylmalate/(R)-2-methylmalate dehydratase small subunit
MHTRQSLTATGGAWVYGDKVDTDLLAPGAYMKGGIAALAAHCLEAIDPHFAGQVAPGDIVVGGNGFGVGSSREQAAEALLHLKVGAVVAKSFARIFFRNAINLGLPLIVCDWGEGIAKGDRVRADAATGLVENLTTGQAFQGEALPDFLLDMIAAGGLMGQLHAEMRARTL